MLQAYVAAILIGAASLLVGSVIVSLAGLRSWCWFEPGIGFAVLIATGGAVAWASGSAGACAAALLAVVLAAASLSRRSSLPSPAGRWEAAGVTALVLVAVAVPFLAAGHWGALGAEALRPQVEWAGWLHGGATPPPAENVLGPIALADTVARVPGIQLGAAFQGELFAVMALSGITAIGAFDRLRARRRTLAACMVAVAYMSVSFLTLAAVRTTAEAFFALTTAVALVQVERRWVVPTPIEGAEAARLVPVAIAATIALGAGAFFTNSVAGLVWPVAIALRWSLNRPEVRSRLRSRSLPRPLASRAAVLTLVALVALGWLTIGAVPFSVGHLAAAGAGEPVSPVAGLGIWPHGSYALDGGYEAWDWLAAVVAVGTVALAIVWWLRRRETAGPVAFGVSSVIYLLQPVFASQYTRAQALAIVAPLAMLVAMRPLLEEAGGEATPSRRGGFLSRLSARTRLRRTGWALLAVAFIGGAAYSSGLALSDAEVGGSAVTARGPSDRSPSRGPLPAPAKQSPNPKIHISKKIGIHSRSVISFLVEPCCFSGAARVGLGPRAAEHLLSGTGTSLRSVRETKASPAAARWLEGVADPIRLGILRSLSETSEATTAELATRGAASSQTLRRHLEVLVTLGVIREHPPRPAGDRPGRPATRFSLPVDIRESVRSLFDSPSHVGRAAAGARVQAGDAL